MKRETTAAYLSLEPFATKKEDGMFLAFREQGDAAAEAITALAQPDVLLAIDFANAGDMEGFFYSRITQALRAAANGRTADDFRNVKAVMLNTTADVRDEMRILQQWPGVDKAGVAVAEGGSIDLVGGLLQTQKTFAEAQRLTEANGTFTAVELGHALDMKGPSTNQHLNSLSLHGAIGKVRDKALKRGRGGVQFRYEAVTPAHLELLK